MAGATTLTVGKAGDADARALYARMASVTGSIARGFLDGTTATATTRTADLQPVASTAATASTTGTTVASDTRISGAGLHLNGTTLFGHGGARNDLFANLRSAIQGFDAQTGFDQLLVTRLITA